MLNKKNLIPSQGSFYLDYLESLSSISNSHSSVTSSFDNINALYSESSVMEDILLNNYLYLYSAARQIRPEAIKSNFVTESFLSQNFFDAAFPIDDKLNIDIQNGDLTLPIIATNDIEVTSIIVESDSNGGIGDSNNNNENADISIVAAKGATSIFIYDKVVNSLAMSPLYLSLTLRLKESTNINGVYIQLYSDTGSSYANIDLIQGSDDGVSWYDIASGFKLAELESINKSDYYIRFQSQLTRFIRVRFTQKDNSPISTGFGTRYRYMIGLRNIVVKQTVYATSGEYVSTPFSNKRALSYLSILTEDTGGVSYSISANNGSIWQPIIPGKKLYLYNSTLGLRDGIDVGNIRLKIGMDKSFIAINKEPQTEYANVNDSGSYYLQSTPVEISASIGRHISYGDLQPYTLQLSDITKVTAGILEDAANIDHTAILYYVPFTSAELMQSTLELKLNGAKVRNLSSIYSFAPHPDQNHSIIIFKNPDLTATSGILTLSFARLDMGLLGGNQEMALPFPTFLTSNDAFLVQEVKADTSQRTLSNFQYSVSDNILKINDTAFDETAIYYISYYPSIDISYLIDKVKSNEIVLQGAKSVLNAKLKFTYSVSSETSASDLQYFTPISNQYILELR